MYDDDGEENSSRWWWNNLEADAGPMEVWKRLIPALVGIIALLNLPTSLIFVAAAGMAFDDPASRDEIWPYLAAFWFSIFPLVLVACVVFGFLAFARFTKTRLLLTFAIPLGWLMPVAAIMLVARG